MVVTATGMQTQMGQIATMLTSVTRTRSPLQKELDSLTKVLGIIAWSAVAFIFVVGLARGMDAQELFLLGTAMAISAIPTGLPAFVSGLLSIGREAAGRRQGDREEPDRCRDAGRDERDQHRQDGHAHDEPDDGVGRLRERRLVHGRGRGLPQDGRDHVGRRRSGAGLHQPCARHGARQRRDGCRRRGVVGDPTEAALVVLSAKLDVDAEETRRSYPRLAEVPFDSEYKFMATFHRATLGGRERIVQLVKGGPDVVLARCARSGGPMSETHVPIDDARPDIDAANERMGGAGSACARVRGALRGGRRARCDAIRSDVAHAGPRLRRHGRHHRPAPSRSQGSGAAPRSAPASTCA